MATKANGYGPILVSVSLRAEDHLALRGILGYAPWEIRGVATVGDGMGLLRGHDPVPVVICEESLPDGGWRWMLGELDQLPVRPNLIVSARLADDRLWAEALNLGAYDVVTSAPFEAEEVLRVTQSAWLSWTHAREQKPARRMGQGVARQPEPAAVQALTGANRLRREGTYG